MEQQKSGGGIAKWLLLGCGGIIAVGVIIVAAFFVWALNEPESGVKMGNEMDKYALDYLATHKILGDGEEVLAYYDATMGMDGTEAAILTRERVMYHKDGRTTTINIKDVRDVRHRYESLIGDVIEVEDVSGKVLKIEIAPLNQGTTFKNVLMSTWTAAKSQPGV